MWTIYLGVGLGFVYAFRPIYDEEGLERQLKERYAHEVKERSEKNKHLREALMRYKEVDAPELIRPTKKDFAKPLENSDMERT